MEYSNKYPEIESKMMVAFAILIAMEFKKNSYRKNIFLWINNIPSLITITIHQIKFIKKMYVFDEVAIDKYFNMYYSELSQGNLYDKR